MDNGASDPLRLQIVTYLVLVLFIILLSGVIATFFGSLVPDILTPVPVAGGGTGPISIDTPSGTVQVISITNPTDRVLSFAETVRNTPGEEVTQVRCIIIPPDGKQYLVQRSGTMSPNLFRPGNVVHVYYDGTYQQNRTTGETTAGFWLTNDIWTRKRLEGSPIADITEYPATSREPGKTGYPGQGEWSVLIQDRLKKDIVFKRIFTVTAGK